MRKIIQKGRERFGAVWTKALKRILSVLLICVLFVGIIPAAARAETSSAEKEEEKAGQKPAGEEEDDEDDEDDGGEARNVEKEEVVYGSMSASGELKDIYVVNAFTVPYDCTIKDYGNYSKVENLTDLTPLKDEDGIITADVKKGRFYYQGDLKKKKFPWKIDIVYKLNGEEHDADFIGGESGKVEILIHISQNPDVDPVYYEKYMLVVSVTLDTNVCSRIKAKGAMISNAGSDKMLNFIAMPEKESEFKIKFRTKNFSMKGITFAGMPASLDKDMLDIGQIDEMTDGLSQLAEGISTLSEGADTLDYGMQEFSEGTGRLGDGATQLHSGIEQLSDGTAQLKDGSKQFRAGIEQLAKSSDELVSGSAQINSIFQLLKQMTGQLGSIDPQSLQRLKDSLSTLRGRLGEARDRFNAIIDRLPGLLISKELLHCTDDIMDAIDAQMDSMADIEIIQPDAIANMTNMVGTFADQFQMFHDGIVQYTGGVKALAENYAKIDEGIQGLAGGLSQTESGSRQLMEGVGGVSSGADQLSGGMSQLASGIRELKNRTSDMPSQVKEGVDDMLEKFSDPDFTPTSFVSKKNGHIQAVQFVSTTEEIKGLAEGEIKAKEPEKKSFWQKLLDLFR